MFSITTTLISTAFQLTIFGFVVRSITTMLNAILKCETIYSFRTQSFAFRDRSVRVFDDVLFPYACTTEVIIRIPFYKYNKNEQEVICGYFLKLFD